MFSIFRKLKILKAMIFLSSFWMAGLSVANSPFDSDKVMFFIGQDTGTITDFKESVLVKTDFPNPAGSVFYTNILYLPDQEDTALLAGIFNTIILEQD